MMKCEELHSKWLNETITLQEIDEYADCTLQLLLEYDQEKIYIEDVYDYEAIQHIILSPPKVVYKIQKDNMESWFTAMMMALDEEMYELCGKIKKITEIYETLFISAIYKFRKELFTDEFLSKVIKINEINNKVIKNGI